MVATLQSYKRLCELRLQDNEKVCKYLQMSKETQQVDRDVVIEAFTEARFIESIFLGPVYMKWASPVYRATSVKAR